ncbi:hypothetical protein EMIHUDRAFT_216586 [Emiliania huxleyi CCMP1516]|uniref:Uncharacterized protein n=2 Tax=Emiliania huxleyi TaxID=2903 RepID=A0A0D3I098_EMIH1|nr:hypothetical protein EMIHUDRAFT_220787 [Emiliania huxleyi CCMP1516]XP_005761660.1 hypothetical protein EMIHUDRAFT_216586 [Emiliania huxleyi CCMP1516]EOD04683.1 hypothetical protein EMIHUDRAFT_220787 [Emiliania huxleyi CCMP1516]EOD09231.1 hypothetical protein EMIHUDRAFT_216586 [Emiliania huxleyi CCMP1516]|eukprot:XP_005757112.1 hypothetical protein EMIHUDRAFT_220787 [Emiliania huxleyi CCMP1516]
MASHNIDPLRALLHPTTRHETAQAVFAANCTALAYTSVDVVGELPHDPLPPPLTPPGCAFLFLGEETTRPAHKAAAGAGHPTTVFLDSKLRPTAPLHALERFLAGARFALR